MFGHRYATRSPGPIPDACRARARRVASEAKSRYEVRRSPWTIATLSGKTSAERSRKRSGVSELCETAGIGPIVSRGRSPRGHRRPLREGFGDGRVGDLAVPDVQPSRKAGVLLKRGVDADAGEPAN